jgi:hypothetical protein
VRRKGGKEERQCFLCKGEGEVEYKTARDFKKWFGKIKRRLSSKPPKPPSEER